MIKVEINKGVGQVQAKGTTNEILADLAIVCENILNDCREFDTDDRAKRQFINILERLVKPTDEEMKNYVHRLYEKLKRGV